MGRKAKRGAKRVRRDGDTAVAPADCASPPDGEGGRRAAGGNGLPAVSNIENHLTLQAIPKSVKISSGAEHLTHNCTVEFVADEASGQARAAQRRRTVMPEDFTPPSFQTLGADDCVEAMSAYTRPCRGGYRTGEVRYYSYVMPTTVPPPHGEDDGDADAARGRARL